MNSARIFASRNHIMEWINHVLNITMTKIQQLGSGVIYCLLLDSAYPQRVPISKLKWYANTQVDYIYNFKLLQTSFCHLGIQKKIEINKLIKSKYQDNLDFIQWLKWFLQAKIDQVEYDALQRRQNRQVYLDFYQHKILKLPFDNSNNIKGKQKYCLHIKQAKNIRSSNMNTHLNKNNNINSKNNKMNKRNKKIYDINDNFLQIYECRTEQSDNDKESKQKQYDIKNNNKLSRQIKSKLLKTATNFRPKKYHQLQLNNYISKSDQQQFQYNKQNNQTNQQNACLTKNNNIPLNQNHNLGSNLNNTQCMYTSPKQIRKFYFPQRFSQRLKRRVDVINGLRKSQIKNRQINNKIQMNSYLVQQQQCKQKVQDSQQSKYIKQNNKQLKQYKGQQNKYKYKRQNIYVDEQQQSDNCSN